MTNLSLRYSLLSLIAFVAICQVVLFFVPAQVTIYLAGGSLLASAALAWIVMNRDRAVQLYDVIKIVTDVCRQIDQGNFETRITVQGEGQVKELYDAVNAAIDRTDAFVREATSVMQAVAKKKYYRPILEVGMTGAFLKASRDINLSVENLNEMQQAASTLCERVKTVMTQVVQNTDTVIAESREMGQRIDDSSSGVIEVADVTRATTESAELIVGATEQLSDSVREITVQASSANDISNDAMDKNQGIQDDIRQLSEQARNIDDVIQFITDIAAQTNLLALNATIEAARAGEAGKGFAVVAGEVKNLAQQTAKATDRIAEQIMHIQGATENVVAKTMDISGTISRIHEASGAIAAAVEEQGAATADIADKIQGLAASSNDIATYIGTIAQSSAASYASAIKVMWVSDDQKEPVHNLDDDLQKFFNMVM